MREPHRAGTHAGAMMCQPSRAAMANETPSRWRGDCASATSGDSSEAPASGAKEREREQMGRYGHKCRSLGREAENSLVFADPQTLTEAFDSLRAEQGRDRC